jgi:two-component system invasion response regulator UvrY
VVRVFIVEDHPIVRDGLRRLLDATDDIQVVGETDSGSEAVQRARGDGVDVLLLDLDLPGMDGMEVLRQVREARRDVRVLIWTAHPEDQLALRLLADGAAGYLCKRYPAAMLVEAIRTVHGGQRYLTPRLATLLLEREGDPGRDPLGRLSGRQVEILRMIGQGRSPSEVAHDLGLTASTVSTHLHHIKTKLGLRSVGELAQYALRHGLI